MIVKKKLFEKKVKVNIEEKEFYKYLLVTKKHEKHKTIILFIKIL